MIDTVVLDVEGRVSCGTDVATVVMRLRQGRCRAWLDFNNPTEAELDFALEEILPAHELARKDVQDQEGTPRLAEYPNCLVVVFHSVEASGTDPAGLSTVEHVAVLGHNLLMTFTYDDRSHFAEMHDPARHRSDGLALGTVRLFHELLDCQVGQARELIENLVGSLESLGDVIFTRNLSAASEHEIMEDILQAKSTALRLQRILGPQAELLRKLAVEHRTAISPQERAYFQVTLEESVHQESLADLLVELANGTMTTHLNLSNYRLSEVMKVLTMIATVFIPLTFVTGLFGMNFAHLPGTQSPYALVAVVAACLVLTIGMLLFFRRKRWL